MPSTAFHSFLKSSNIICLVGKETLKDVVASNIAVGTVVNSSLITSAGERAGVPPPCSVPLKWTQGHS